MVNSVIAGDHRLIIAEPVGVRVNHGDRPLTSLDLDYVYLGGRNVIARDRSRLVTIDRFGNCLVASASGA